jgi:hypothetical protein
MLHNFVRERGKEAYGRLLNESKGDNILDAVIETGGPSQETDKSQGEAKPVETPQKTGQKINSGAALLGCITVMRQLENHFFLAENFFRDIEDDDWLRCIEETLANMTGDDSNIDLIFQLRETLGRAHRRRNRDHLQESGSPEPGSFVHDEEWGVHGCFKRSYAGEMLTRYRSGI